MVYNGVEANQYLGTCLLFGAIFYIYIYLKFVYKRIFELRKIEDDARKNITFASSESLQDDIFLISTGDLA